LSTLESFFRQDYISRCREKKKDPLSRVFRQKYKSKKEKVNLENEILEEWKAHYPDHKKIIGDIKGTLKFRHWLAHGRYWKPNFSKYDILSIYNMANTAVTTLPFEVF
jgi:hypothetical protein